jgi:tetratricopeptide (TPR) repeat protein
MATAWYYAIDGIQYGPVNARELKSLADSRKLLPAHLLWKNGLKNWVKAEKFKGLFDTPAIAPQALPQISPLPEKRVQIQTNKGGKGDKNLSIPLPQQPERLCLKILSNPVAEKNPDLIKAKFLKTFINRRGFLFIGVAVILVASIPLWEPLLGTLDQTTAPSRAPSPVKLIESEWGPIEAQGEAIVKEGPKDKGGKAKAEDVPSKEWNTLNDEVMSLYRQGSYDRAVVVAKRALQVAEQEMGPNHLCVAKSLNNLAELYRTQGQYVQAEPLYKRSLAIKETSLGPDHSDVAIGLNNLAFLYYIQGQYAQADPLYKRSLAIREKALGPNHPDVAQSLENMAALYRKSGEEKEAEAIEKRAAAIRAIKQ